MNKEVPMKEIINISKAIKLAEEQLITVSLDKNIANIEAVVLLSYILAKPKSYLLTWPEQEITTGQWAMYNTLIEKRKLGEPLAYIIGQKEFFSLMLNVDSNTLIPRPETELLVETVLEKFKTQSHSKLNLLDLGTGSGAIAIALAKTRPAWKITAVDKSELALAVARKNAILHQADNICFMKSHWTDALEQDQQFDCIVTNPPYIAANDPHLEQGDLRFEPKTALIADNNGLADIEYILKQSYYFLKPNGLMLIEHGYQQLQDIKSIVDNLELYSEFSSIKDYAGLPRVVVIRK